MARGECLWCESTKMAEGRLSSTGRVYFKADLKTTYEKVYPVLEYMNKTMGMSNVDLAIAKDSGDK